MLSSGCSEHDNCRKAYPCMDCYYEDHPAPACGHRMHPGILFEPFGCERHRKPLPEYEHCGVCGEMVSKRD